MKRLIVFILALTMVISCFTGIVWAEDSAPITAAGFYSIGSTTGLTVSAKTAAGADITATSANVDGADGYETFYPNSEKLNVQVADTTVGMQYLVLLVTGSELPDSSSQICYINQVEATGTTVDFTVYPMLPTETTQMALFITSNADGFTTKSVLLNYAINDTYQKAPYKLGDVNNDGKWNSSDALMTLKIGAGLQAYTDIQWNAANVTSVSNGDDIVNSSDALKILRYGAGLISSWE